MSKEPFTNTQRHEILITVIIVFGIVGGVLGGIYMCTRPGKVQAFACHDSGGGKFECAEMRAP